MNDNSCDQTLFKEFFDNLPQVLFWLYPIHDDRNSIIDFKYAYFNKAALQYLRLQQGVPENLTVFNATFIEGELRSELFSQMVEVYVSGNTFESTIHNPVLSFHGRVFRTKFRNGVLNTIYDNSAETKVISKLENQTKELEYQRSFSNGILDASPDGIFAMEAVKNEYGSIIDFKILKTNRAYNKIVGKSAAEVDRKSFLSLHPNTKTSGTFFFYCQVIETGLPVRKELFYEGENVKGWFAISIVKFGENGIVCTFSDISERKKAEIERDQNNLLVQTMLNASFHGKALLEPIRDEQNGIVDFRVIATNTSSEKQIGIKQSAAIGAPLSKILPGYKKNGGFERYKDIFESGQPRRYEQFYHDERFEGWFDIYVVPVNNGIVLSFANITERKQEILAIQQQKNLLDAITTNSPSGISVTEIIRDENGKPVDGRTLLVNEAAIRYVGVPKEVYLSKTVKELDPQFMKSPLYTLMLNTLATGKGFQTQHFMKPTKKWLDISVAKMDDDHLLNVFTDVTTTKEAQLKVEQFAEKLNIVINTSQAGFFLGVPVANNAGEIIDFRFTMVNKVLASFVDREPHELVGELGSDWFVAYKKNGLFEHFKKTYLTGNQQHFDLHYIGETVEVWANVMTTKLGDELLGSFTDFTPIKTLQLQLEKSVEELSRSNKNLEEFAYAASHDLQEPLRKINFFSEQIRKDLSLHITDENSKKFDRMQNATNRMRTLIDDLLEYSKVSVKADMFEDVELSVIVEQVLQDLEAAVIKTSAVIRVDQLPKIKGDVRQLTQLFQNILSNSLKYARTDLQPQISIKSALVNDTSALTEPFTEPIKAAFYLIEIKDNGIGFEQQHADKIFQVFQRLHGRSEYEGTGVGLAIAQKVVANHNGYIRATSQPDKGATFQILLPVSK